MDDPPDGLVVEVGFADEVSFEVPESADEAVSDFFVPDAVAGFEAERESVR